MSNNPKRNPTAKTPERNPGKEYQHSRTDSYLFQDPNDSSGVRNCKIDPHTAQASVPHLLSKKSKDYKFYKKHRHIHEVYDPTRVDPKKLEEYLAFVKSLHPEMGGPTVGMLMAYNPSMEEKAIEFLHNMKYSFTKAKFYLLFPTLLTWNDYSADSLLEISEKEMEEKINFYITQMQETKTSQHEKWKNELQELLSSRVLISRLMAFLEQGKSLGFKNEIPDFLKEMLTKTTAFSKEIKHKMNQKTTLEKLEELRIQSEEYKIISNEMLELNESIERSKKWLESINKLGEGPYSFRELEIAINDYKNVPLEHDDYQKYKKILDESKEFLDKLPNFTKLNKTRHNSNFEKIPLDTAKQYAQRISTLNIRCEEFDAFFKALEAGSSAIENANMFLEDENAQKNLNSVTAAFKELSTYPFTDRANRKLQDYIDYFTIVDRMTKSLYSKNKIEDVESDLAYCKTRGFSSEEIDDIADKVKKIRELYAKTEEFLNSKKTFNTKLLFQNYSTVTLNSPEESYLLQLIANGEELLADRNVLGELYTLRDMVASFKERTKEHLAFEEMIHLLNEGFSLNFKTPELYNLFEKAKKILIWTMQAANLIKKYEPGFKSKLLTESTNAEPSLQSLLNLPILQGDDYKEMQMLTADHPSDNFQSMEFDKLLDLKKRSENWSYKSRHILNTKNFTEEIISQLLKEGENYPTETTLRNELTEINKLLHWINRAKDVLANQSENLPLIQGLSELGVENLANQLTEFKDFYKEDAVRFLNKNRDSIYALLKLISSPDNKLKPSAYSLEYIEGLLKEVDNIKVPEENQHLIQELHGILDRGRNWLLQYQKLKQVERKKKSKAAKKGRGRRPNPKKEEHKERDISEAKESERQEVSVIDIEERKEDNEAEEEEKIQEEGDVKEEGEGEGEAEGEAEGEEPAEKIEEKIEEKQEDGANQDQAQKIDDSEAPENVEVKSEVKEEAEVEKAKVEAEKTKQLYARDSDNFFYFFKLPLFLAAFYDGLDAKVPIEDLKNIKNYLIEINIFIESTNKALNRKLKLDDLSQMITQGIKLKLFLVETEQCQKLYKWGSSWLSFTLEILKVIPYTEQQFRKPGQKATLEEQAEMRISNLDFEKYHIAYDEDNFEFVLTRKEEYPIIEEESPDKDEIKRFSRREKKINKKFQDASFTLYDPDVPRFDDTSRKASDDKKRGSKRKAPTSVTPPKKQVQAPQKVTVKEIITKKRIPLKEENPDEHYCICRKGHDGIAWMIACDRCQEWFHGDCVGLSKTLFHKKTDFICFACQVRYNYGSQLEYSAFLILTSSNKLIDYAWTRYNKISIEEFFALAEEGRALPLDIPEIQEMNEVEGRIREFLRKSEAEVAKGAQIDHLQNVLELSTMDRFLKEFEKSQLDREKAIKTLYLESLGLPVKLKIADELMLILQRRDLASEMIKLLHGKPNAKNIKKILGKDHSHIDIEKDPDLKVIHDKLKGKYEVSSKIVERMNQLLEQKSEPAEFGKLLKVSEESNMYIEKFDIYKKAYEEFMSWEARVRQAIQNKLEKDVFCSLQRDYINLSFKSNLIGQLNDIISEAEEWQRKALSHINNTQSSPEEEKQLIKEGHELRCKCSFLDYLESKGNKPWLPAMNQGSTISSNPLPLITQYNFGSHSGKSSVNNSSSKMIQEEEPKN